MNYHVIEKGLTMPKTRLGFGEVQILSLIELIRLFQFKGFSKNIMEYDYSLKILKEYLEYHNIRNFKLKENIENEIKNILRKKDSNRSSKQQFYNREEYFASTGIDFEKFALSRYSVRNFTSEKIPNQILERCINTAIKSPSSCNRQPVKVYAIKGEKTKEEILNLQSGNRGFGHLADTVLVVTTNISFFQNYMERHELALNAGMFSMSLLFALHNEKIAACSLNWSVHPKKDKDLHNLINIPKNEMINLLIVCGYTPKNFSVANSPRNNSKTVLKIIE